jgi:zinc transporter ZupT
MHNLCDGFFVGAAFNECSDSMAWGITIATILHELPQELSDYLILTGPQVGLSTMTALAINFATGLSVILGVVIVLAVDVSTPVTGLLLAFGGGIYLQIGCVECMPKMVNSALTPRRKMFCVLFFIVGAVLIGLVLLDHEHCIAEGGGHDGHGH